jgi:hypothetical protein
MIQASELRIGNWLIFDGFVKVDYIFTDGFYCIGSDGCSYKSKWSELEPIPLTPEILEKAGFDRRHPNVNEFDLWVAEDTETLNGINQISIVLENGNWVLELWHFDYSYTTNDDHEQDLIDIKVQYIHQLQNLYFALTGQELEITL